MQKRKVYREIRERLFWRSAKRKIQGGQEKRCWYVLGCVYVKEASVRNRKQEAERASQNQEKDLSSFGQTQVSAEKNNAMLFHTDLIYRNKVLQGATR